MVAPKYNFAANSETGEQYIVIEDGGTIMRLMNSKGQIYVVAAFRCKVATASNNQKYYSCGVPMHPVTCSKLVEPRDLIALEQIKPRVFGK